MYSMVLVASLATAGDAPAFGKKDNGGCNGAGCAGVVVVNGGCNGCDGGRAGFLGLCGRHKNKGCNGGGCNGYAGCSGYVPTPVYVPAPAPTYGCYGSSSVNYGCNGCNGCDGGRAGFLGLCGRHKNKGHGCNGGTVVYSGCYGGGAGCYGSVPVVAGPVVAGPVTGPVVMPMGDGGVRVADPKAMPEVKTVPVKK